MFPSALVFFREVFEIVLIVGIVLAATRGLPGRAKWVYLGFAGGLAGSALVAIFTEQISNFADGVGQEIFNASILFTAAFFIGWTVIWMKRHAREMKAYFTRVGQDVAEGKIPAYSLSLVIALAMLREGSEIVLFSYGMLAGGQVTVANLIIGALIGLGGGLALGLLFYYGLLKISPRYFMQITSWMLVLLVAGMMSQGVGMLVSAGYFENFSATVWNSSWLLADDHILGKSLGVLIGYTSRPVEAQVAIYAITLIVLYGLTKLIEKHNSNPKPAQAASA
jgi:high-affinity iron transporter